MYTHADTYINFKMAHSRNKALNSRHKIDISKTVSPKLITMMVCTC